MGSKVADFSQLEGNRRMQVFAVRTSYIYISIRPTSVTTRELLVGPLPQSERARRRDYGVFIHIKI